MQQQELHILGGMSGGMKIRPYSEIDNWKDEVHAFNQCTRKHTDLEYADLINMGKGHFSSARRKGTALYKGIIKLMQKEQDAGICQYMLKQCGLYVVDKADYELIQNIRNAQKAG